MSPAARLRLFYFLYYGSIGASLPYLAPYLRGLGFSGAEIGTVQMVSPLVAGPASLTWALAADRLGQPARALRLATLWSLAAMAFLPIARTPAVLAAVLFLHALGVSAVVPLVDSVALEWVRTQPGLTYARVRLFGSLGFIALAQGLGLCLAARGDRPADILVPLAVVGAVAGYALTARRLPAPPRPEVRPGLADLAGLVGDRRLLVLLAAAALHWAGCAPFHLFYGVFVRDLGLPSSLTGLGMAAGVGAEVLVLLGFPRLRGRFSLRALFALAFAATALRWWLLSRSGSPLAVVGLQAIHGLTFGLFWGASVEAMSALVPARLRATGQALFGAVVFGGGNALGYQLSGLGYDHYRSVAPLYAWAAGLELVPLCAALALSLAPRTGEAAAGEGGVGPAPPGR
ncbi:MAG TPA: MFS transporter [Anaeromyxobacteraceae bacterium]|nr:MFS transporter [Anaeromyxobacteraceae bacterium]